MTWAALAGCVLVSGWAAEPGVAAQGGRFGQLEWDWNPWILASLALATLAYGAGLHRMGKGVRSRVIGAARCAAFGAGIVALVAVLISPLDALDDQLFTAHMLQHLVLMMVGPPLLLLGRPGLVFLWAFPLHARRWIGRAWSRTGLRNAMHTFMSPLLVWVLCSAALWFWHLPRPYGWALGNEFVHAIEHVCFFGTSLMFWSLVLEPVGCRRVAYGSAMLFVATFGIQNGLLGAILTFAGSPWYGAYLPTTAEWGLTPLEDQQLAGLLMWIPASIIHLSTLGILFLGWMRAAERREIATASSAWAAARDVSLRGGWMVLIAAMALSACRRNPDAPAWRIDGSHPSRGPALVQKYGCGSCHTIPGIPRAVGQVGPPLERFGQRSYIAGMLPNTPGNLMKWLQQPQSIVPGNAMPEMGVTEQDARDLAAYLVNLPARWTLPYPTSRQFSSILIRMLSPITKNTSA